MEIAFTKLQGNGNDFILIDEHDREVIPEDMKGAFAALYCDRRFGIGADGILFLQASEKADIRMRLFQPDESEAAMCGNGIRCLAKYAYDAGYVKESCSVETGVGSSGHDGVCGRRVHRDHHHADARVRAERHPCHRDRRIQRGDPGFTVYAVNTGVPHAVVFVKEIGAVDIATAGPAIRNHPTFVEGANVNFVEQGDGDTIRIRTFERGVEAETFSCGTGATASAAVAHHLGNVGDEVRVETKGGPLIIRFGDSVTMEGPASTVFAGVISF